MKRLLMVNFLFVIFFGLCNTPIARADTSVWEKTVKSTVWIVSDMGSGSGVIVENSEGEIVVATNYHVIEDAAEILCYFPQFDSNGEVVANRLHYLDGDSHILASVLETDGKRDLALLQLAEIPSDVQPIKLATKVQPGSEIHVIGNSGAGTLFGYAFGHIRGISDSSCDETASRQDNVFKSISTIDEYSFPFEGCCIVTDVPINPGDSGGPAVRKGTDGSPELVGLSQSYTTDGRLISNLVHVSELAQLLRGENTTVDKRLSANLDELGFDASPNANGQFVVASHGQLVYFESDTYEAGGEKRDIWAPIIDPEEDFSVDVYRSLLKANTNLRLGRIQIREISSDYYDYEILAYCVAVAADANAEEIRITVEAISDAVASIRNRIDVGNQRDEYSYDYDEEFDVDDTLVGTWEAVSDENDILTLHFGDDGSCRLECGKLTASGTYSLTDGDLSMNFEGTSMQISGTVEFVGPDSFFLEFDMDGKVILFERKD